MVWSIMASQRTEKSKYLSKYGEPGEELYVGAAQYLAERIMEKQAAKDNKHLPIRFWNDPAWKKHFLAQLKHANKLLKEFESTTVLKALNHFRMKNIYSLGLRSVIDPICEEIQRANTLSNNSAVIIDEIDTTQKPRPSFGKQTLRNKLKGI